MNPEPNTCCPFGRRRKEKKGKESPLWVNCEREERCMVDLAGVVDVAGMRDVNIYLFALNGQRSSPMRSLG